MKLVKYSPETSLNRFFDIDPFFSDFWPKAWFGDREVSGDPLKVNIVESEDRFTLTAEVPGLTEKDIDLEVKDGRMTLKGHSEVSEEKEEAHYRMREFSRRRFERSFRIGEGVDSDNISARLAHGLLTVDLPKKETARPKSVKVEIGS